MDINDFISISDAARKLGAGRATLYRALDDGRLNGVDVAGKTVIVQDEKWEEFEPEQRGTRHPNYGKGGNDE
jgi:excisionase family DNA binding protein